MLIVAACGSSQPTGVDCEATLAPVAVDAGGLAFVASFATFRLRATPFEGCPTCGIMADIFLTEEPDACTGWGANSDHADLKTLWLGVVSPNTTHDFKHTFSVSGCPGCLPMPGGDAAGTLGINGSFIANVHIPTGATYTSPSGTAEADPSYRYAIGSITIKSYVDLVSIAGSFTGTFADGSIVTGAFDAKFCSSACLLEQAN
jgi:hypothetical protein